MEHAVHASFEFSSNCMLNPLLLTKALIQTNIKMNQSHVFSHHLASKRIGSQTPRQKIKRGYGMYGSSMVSQCKEMVYHFDKIRVAGSVQHIVKSRGNIFTTRLRTVNGIFSANDS